jgi:hypothetical protein
MQEAKIKEKLEGNQKNSHILSHTHTTQKNSKPILVDNTFEPPHLQP